MLCWWRDTVLISMHLSTEGTPINLFYVTLLKGHCTYLHATEDTHINSFYIAEGALYLSPCTCLPKLHTGTLYYFTNTSYAHVNKSHWTACNKREWQRHTERYMQTGRSRDSYTHTHMCAHAHTHTHVCTNTHVCNTHVCMHAYTHTHTNVHTHTHTHTQHTHTRAAKLTASSICRVGK